MACSSNIWAKIWMKWRIGYTNIWGESIPDEAKVSVGSGGSDVYKEADYLSESVRWVVGNVLRELTDRY